MNRYVQSVVILIGWRSIEAAVIEAQFAPNLYCEVFESINFDGESVQVPESHKIINFTQLTQSWSSSGSHVADQFYSFKLPLTIPAGINCVVKSCTSENFHGNCTVFKLSQKRIQSCRLKSFECSCSHGHGDDVKTNIDGTVTNDDDDAGQSTVKSACDDEFSKFQNFAQQGKKIIGVGRNYM